MPSHTRKGQAPSAGQHTKYETLEGETYSKAVINSVGDKSDDGEYYNVNVTWTPPGEDLQISQTGDHVYWTELGWVVGNPPGPPWPG